MFGKIPEETFEEFHARVQGEGWWWRECADCGGKCEYNKIGSLLPGEKEFLARHFNLPVNIFADRYLDELITPMGTVDVLKLKDGCPFLDARFRCTIRDKKVVLCETYPVAFYVEHERPVFFIDPWCRLSRQQDVRDYFKNVAIPALVKLDVPVEWYKAVELFDECNFDYHRIEQERKDPGHDGPKCRSFSLDYLMSRRRPTP